jgi:hypothetical protein
MRLAFRSAAGLVVFYYYEYRTKYLCTELNYYSIIIVLHNLEVHK